MAPLSLVISIRGSKGHPASRSVRSIGSSIALPAGSYRPSYNVSSFSVLLTFIFHFGFIVLDYLLSHSHLLSYLLFVPSQLSMLSLPWVIVELLGRPDDLGGGGGGGSGGGCWISLPDAVGGWWMARPCTGWRMPPASNEKPPISSSSPLWTHPPSSSFPPSNLFPLPVLLSFPPVCLPSNAYSFFCPF